MSRRRAALRRESGQVFAIVAIMLPVFVGIGAIVVGVGNWYTHGRHLQTKADAGALAGGTEWAFPCGPQVDADIAATARLYSGSQNPQVGGVPNTSVHTVLNGPAWYDDDVHGPSNPPVENLAICDTMRLDVKVTEDNSFPLFSLIPIFPDIKRKAVVELFEGGEFSGEGLLPIAVRAPVPLSAAIFYNEANGSIYRVKYFVKNNAISGLPANMQGWTTLNTEDSSAWASFAPGSKTGVAIGISFFDACGTNLPNPNTKIPVATGGQPCFEDEHATISQLCNQGGSIAIVDCHYATGTNPNQIAQNGLHFIRGYSDVSPGTGTPAVETAYLENISCAANGYYNWQRTPSGGGNCNARLHLKVDAGGLIGDYPPLNDPAGDAPIRPADVEVRFRLVRSGGANPQDQCDFGVNCDLVGGGSGSNLSYQTSGSSQSPDLLLRNNSQVNAVAISIRVKNAVNATDPDCRATGFNNNCRFFFLGSGQWTGNPEIPPDAQILADPVQRSFRGNSLNSGSVQWLRLTTDGNCDGAVSNPSFDAIDVQAASRPNGGNSCFVMDMGLKGGLALDADEPPILFDDGTGASQTGTVDCDPAVPQGQALKDSIEFGCAPWYAPHSFTGTPLCPQQNDIFDQPNPGPPWLAWPPLTCVKTRPTSTPSQMENGFKDRFGITGNQCPSDNAEYVKGRNYWNVANNPLNAANPDPAKRYGYKDDNPVRDTKFHLDDPRIVTIYLVPTDAFTGSGQDTYAIAGFIQVYVTGFGRVQNGGNVNNDDPCPGNTAPPPADLDCQGSDCGYIVWGHFLQWVVPGPSSNPAPGAPRCNPQGGNPCVAVLVE